jgi:hypothetical protein
MKILKFISDTYWNVAGWRIRQFGISIKNLIKWFPLIWQDRDWDHSFIYAMLEFKLTNMAKYFRKRDFFVGQIREAEKMELCVRLMKKVNEDFYSCEYQDVIEEKWGKQEMFVDPSTNYLEFKFIDKDYTEEQLAEINTETSNLIKKCHLKQAKAQRILFALMERNINRWWD